MLAVGGIIRESTRHILIQQAPNIVRKGAYRAAVTGRIADSRLVHCVRAVHFLHAKHNCPFFLAFLGIFESLSHTSDDIFTLHNRHAAAYSWSAGSPTMLRPCGPKAHDWNFIRRPGLPRQPRRRP